MFSECLTSSPYITVSVFPSASSNTPGESQTARGANEPPPPPLRSTKLLWLIQGSNYPLCAGDNVFKSFYHCRPRHHKYFIVFNAINRFNIGQNGPTENAPEWNQSHNTVIVHRYAIEPRLIPPPFQKHFSTGRSPKEAAEGWEKGQRRSERESGAAWELQWPCPCISAPLGTHLSGALSLYFTVTGDILVSRCHGEMAPLPRRSPRRRNQWNNEVPMSRGWNSGGPSWAQRPNPSPLPGSHEIGN